jgi:hypothetical protein
MKLFSTEQHFQHPWALVSAANWVKYPNEVTPHVIHVDYLERRIDPETGILHTKRLLTCRQSVPGWMVRWLGATSEAYVYEESQVDARSKVLRLSARNLTMSNLMQVEETCTYTPSPGDPHATLLKQEASISATNVLSSWISNMIEDFSLERFRANAIKGRAALDHVLERIKQETIGTFIE